MNLEHDNKVIIERKENIVEIPLEEAILKQLGSEFLDSGKFISKEVGKEMREVGIPELVRIHKLISGNNEDEVIFGSVFEILTDLSTSKEYWAIKEQIGKDSEEIFVELKNIKGERAELLYSAITALANGDTDLDKRKSNDEVLARNFEQIQDYKNIQATNDSKIPGGKEFDVNISEHILMNVYFGPIYEGAKIKRLCLQLITNDDKRQKIYHTDDVSQLNTTTKMANDRRLDVGTLHDSYLSYERGMIIIDKNKIPKANEASFMNFDEKDIGGSLETFFREMRKRIGVVVSINNPDRENFSLAKFGQLLDMESLFKIRELCHNNGREIKEIFNQQSPVQKMLIFMEMSLMIEKNAVLGLIAIHDTGLDVLFFGRHLTRRELLNILSSKHLDFRIGDDREKGYKSTSEKIVTNFLSSLDIKGGEASNLIGFFEAVGEVLGPKELKVNSKSHLKSGLEIFVDSDKMPKLTPLDLSDGFGEREKEMLEVLIENGNLTVRAWHKLLIEKYPESWANSSREDFNKYKRKINNKLEVGNRWYIFDGKKGKTRFYYPCISSTKIHSILMDAEKNKYKAKLLENAYKSVGIESLEGAMSLTRKELNKFSFWEIVMSVLNPYVLLHLIKLQKEIEKNPASNRYLDNLGN